MSGRRRIAWCCESIGPPTIFLRARTSVWFSNLRRSAVVIARSIAEGTGHDSDAEFAIELKKARAAGHDLEYNLLLSRDLGFLPQPLHDELNAEVIEVRRMISGLLKSFKGNG